MRLADFLERNAERVLGHTVSFARTMDVLVACDEAALRDHFLDIYQSISSDLRLHESRTGPLHESHDDGAQETAGEGVSAAAAHGTGRAQSGLTASQVVAEYRVMRSSVLRLYTQQGAEEKEQAGDILRFNEAVDQAIYESVLSHEVQVEQMRQIFLGVLGHDLRGPLNSISLTTSLLDHLAPTELKTHTAVLSRSTKRMTALLDSLLEFNRATLGGGMVVNRVEADLSTVCHGELELLQVAHPATRLVITSDGDTRGSFDISKVREAFSNLVNNAVKYSSDGLAPRIHLTGDERSVALAVSNAGNIDSEDASVIFEPMRRGKTDVADRTNLGLGLFIARQIARAHGGELELDTGDGQVSFTITIPKAAATH